MILAIDTSIGTSVAVVTRQGEVLAEHASEDARGHAESIGRLIASVLEAQPDVTAVVAGVGPGPFTGLRVGIAAARAFGFGRGIPVLGVLSHDAIAVAHASHGSFVVLSDARRREQYWTAYSGLDADGLPVVASGPGLTRPDDLVAELGPLASAERVIASAVPAGALGRIAALRLARGLPDAGLQPRYLRSPDVTPSAGPKRVTA